MMFKFREIAGTLCLCDGDHVIHAYDQLTFVVEKCNDGGIEYTIHKYGELAPMTEWMNGTKEKLRLAGMHEWAGNIFLLTEDKKNTWLIDDLQWAIDCTGGIKRLIDKMGAVDV